MLVSPNFLYLNSHADRGEQTDFALATQLSYFLWSTMPDAPLLTLAAEDQLRRPEVFAEQIERMLQDPRSSALVPGFLDAWLTLRDLGSMPPDRKNFKDFYQYDLGAAMRREGFGVSPRRPTFPRQDN